MTFFFIILGVFVLILSSKLYKIASGSSVSRINLVNYSFWILFIFGFVPSLFIVIKSTFLWGRGNHIFEIIGTNRNTHIIAYVSILWSLIGIPLAVCITDSVFFPVNKLTFIKFRNILSFNFGYGYNEKKAFIFILFFSILFSSIFYFNALNNAPILQLFSGNITAMLIERGDFNLGSNNAILKTILNEGIIKLFMIFSLLCYYKTKKSKWFYLFFVLFINLGFLNLAKGSVAPFLYQIIAVLFARSIVKGVFIKAFEGGLFLFIIGILFIFIKGSNGGILEVISGPVLSRLSSQVLGFYYSLNLFPNHNGFLFFSSTGSEIHKLLGLQFNESYGIIMMKDYNSENYVSGHFTSIFLAEAWANFGYFGLILSPIIVGFFLVFVQFIFHIIKFNLFNVALFVHIAVSIPYDKDFISFYYPVGFIFFSFSYLFLVKFSSFFIRS